MSSRSSRRGFLRSAAALAALPMAGCIARAAAATEGLNYGSAKPFSFEALVARAQELAKKPYVPPYRPAPEIVQKIDYDAHGKLRYRSDRALFVESGPYPATFFHLGQLFQSSVKMHEVRAGQAREILYSPKNFDMPADSVAKKLPADAGYAGFRLHESIKRSDWKTQDWVAFLGASYFRTIGALGQYGLSARGVAVNTTAGVPEEFPLFTEFYLESAQNESAPVIIYALLNGPSIAGAYRFACQRTGGVLMDVDAQMFMRSDILQLGVAPLTSMFWFGEHNRGYRVDWRPEVHDSDGLALWTGKGERVFRPLNNPSRVITSSFVDEDPQGFALLQRDRAVENYLDGVNYQRRPSLWVEPLDKWGKGSVQLVEIPTDDEIHDNIVAFWVPEQPAKAGTHQKFRYRLHWLADEPYPPKNSAIVAATRIGRGGEPGKARPEGVTKFVVEFAGTALSGLPAKQIEAQISASRGELSYIFVEPVPHTDRVRAQFDLTATGGDPVELRLFLRQGERALSETWLYQYEPRKG